MTKTVGQIMAMIFQCYEKEGDTFVSKEKVRLVEIVNFKGNEATVRQMSGPRAIFDTPVESLKPIAD